MNSLKVAAIQYDIKWQEPKENLNFLSDQLDTLDSSVDIIILPEMFTTGFSMNVKENADDSGDAIKWMLSQAEKQDAALYGSVMVNEDEQYFNRGYFAMPSGKYQVYDKRHLFSLGKENEYYSPGKEQKCVNFRDWKIFLSICYDLRFPVWLRNIHSYDLLLNIANWPAVRSYAWRNLLRARSIENQAYVVGLNRIGTDGNELDYNGDSMILDYRGEIMVHTAQSFNILTAQLRKAPLDEFRQSHPFLYDKDAFSLDNEL